MISQFVLNLNNNNGHNKVHVLRAIHGLFGISLKDAKYIIDDLFANRYVAVDLPIACADDTTKQWALVQVLRANGVQSVIGIPE